MLKRMGRIIAIIIFVIYIILVLKITLFKDSHFVMLNRVIWKREYIFSSINLVPFRTIIFYIRAYRQGTINLIITIANLLGNIIAFIPAGFLLPVVFIKLKRMKDVMLATFLMIITIEISQFILGLGSFDVDDIILNMLGAFLGMLMYLLFYKIFDRYKA